MDISASADQFMQEMDRVGCVVVENSIAPALVDTMRADLEKASRICRDKQLEKGLKDNTEGTSHHIVNLGDGFLQYVDNNPCDHFYSDFFGSKYILNAFGGNIALPHKPNYAAKIHRDVRTHTKGLNLWLICIVMLDDFTLDNGATYYLAGSHKSDDWPDEEMFYEKADRATGKAGDVILVDANLFHAAGHNKTDQQRRALTIMYSKPYIKPQVDFVRLIGTEQVAGMSDTCRQLFGYKARVPTSLDEWYQQPENRFYQSDQG